MARRTTRTGRLLLGVAALAALVALLIAVPVVLLAAWRYLGPPLPTWHELSSPDDGTLFVRVLCLVGWAGWATFAWAILAEAAAHLLGWRIPAPRWQRRLAAGLVATIALTLSSPAIASGTAIPVRAAPTATAAPSPPIAPTAPVPPAAATPPTGSGTATAARYVEHLVQPGEQMPALAERYLRDKYRWQAIATATYGLTQPDGRSLHPGQTRLYPGWTIRIPTPTTAATPDTHPTTSTADRSALPVYRVARGDWLWHIAGRFLDDPDRYAEIATLNPHLEHRDGRFPDHIEATWLIVLPADAHDRGPRTHATGTLHTPTRPPTTTPAPDQTRPGGPTLAPPMSPSSPSPTAPSPAPASPPAVGGAPSSSPSPGITSATATPARTPAPTPPATSTVDNGHPDADDDTALDQVLRVGVPLFGAGLAAALLLTTLRRRRRRQEQHRPVGRRLPDPVQPATETQLRVVAQPLAVDRLDQALRALGAALVDRPANQMPDIVGAWLHGDTIHLLLTTACPDPPAPWSGDQLTWTLAVDAVLPDVDGQLAPLPTLVAVGSQPGTHLLLDLERLGLLTIAGDPTRAGDLLRYLAVELACNTWSDHVEITIAGFDAAETAELLNLSDDRIDAAPTTIAIDRIRRRASQVVQSLDHLDAGDPLTGRIADIVADAWMPHILLAHHPEPADLAALRELDNDLAATGRCAVAIAVTTTDDVGRWPIRVDTDGRLSIDFLGLTNDNALTAAGLPRTELAGLADLLATARRGTPPTQPGVGHVAEQPDDWPAVPPAPETEPWACGTDAAGALLDNSDGEHSAETKQPHRRGAETANVPDELASTRETEPAPTTSEPQPTPRPLLPLPSPPGETAAGDDSARIPAVVAAISHPTPTRPRTVTAPVQRRHHDPTLDTDLRAWHDADPIRPRIAVLGPVTVDAPGQLPAERLRFYAEIIVYLAVRGARGATTDQFDEALWPNQPVKATSRRVAVARARRWLGHTPDGQPWLPDATADRRYRLRDGYLLDWHLFRRLRARGEHRGPAGTSDLRNALTLVRGEPLAGADIAYSTAARNPYVWLPQSDIPPHHLNSAIVDTAHRLVDLCLDAADIIGARWACEQARQSDPHQASDIIWRDLFRVAAAEGNTAELDQLLGDLLTARDAEIPEDLDPTTYRLLCDLSPEHMRVGVR